MRFHCSVVLITSWLFFVFFVFFVVQSCLLISGEFADER